MPILLVAKGTAGNSCHRQPLASKQEGVTIAWPELWEEPEQEDQEDRIQDQAGQEGQEGQEDHTQDQEDHTQDQEGLVDHIQDRDGHILEDRVGQACELLDFFADLSFHHHLLLSS